MDFLNIAIFNSTYMYVKTPGTFTKSTLSSLIPKVPVVVSPAHRLYCKAQYLDITGLPKITLAVLSGKKGKILKYHGAIKYAIKYCIEAQFHVQTSHNTKHTTQNTEKLLQEKNIK